MPSKIPTSEIIAIFQQMYAEHWSYVWGKAEKGCVDCSGAFVYAYRQFGKTIAHGSNSIARKYIVELLPISMAEPGMAAFKCRDWTQEESGNRWFGTEPGDIHHVGLVDEDTAYVLNAKGTAYGFCRDKLTAKNGWDYVARLNAVDYGGEPMTTTVTISGGNPDAPIRMRSKPDSSGKIIAEIPQNSTAELISEDGDWDKIKYDDKTGYMMAIFVHKDTPPTPSGDKVEVPVNEIESILSMINKWLGKG